MNKVGLLLFLAFGVIVVVILLPTITTIPVDDLHIPSVITVLPADPDGICPGSTFYNGAEVTYLRKYTYKFVPLEGATEERYRCVYKVGEGQTFDTEAEDAWHTPTPAPQEINERT